MQFSCHQLRLLSPLAERSRQPSRPWPPPAAPAHRRRPVPRALRRPRRPAGRLDVHEYLRLEFAVDDR